MEISGWWWWWWWCWWGWWWWCLYRGSKSRDPSGALGGNVNRWLVICTWTRCQTNISNTWCQTNNRKHFWNMRRLNHICSTVIICIDWSICEWFFRNGVPFEAPSSSSSLWNNHLNACNLSCCLIFVRTEPRSSPLWKSDYIKIFIWNPEWLCPAAVEGDFDSLIPLLAGNKREISWLVNLPPPNVPLFQK